MATWVGHLGKGVRLGRAECMELLKSYGNDGSFAGPRAFRGGRGHPHVDSSSPSHQLCNHFFFKGNYQVAKITEMGLLAKTWGLGPLPPLLYPLPPGNPVEPAGFYPPSLKGHLLHVSFFP